MSLVEKDEMSHGVQHDTCERGRPPQERPRPFRQVSKNDDKVRHLLLHALSEPKQLNGMCDETSQRDQRKRPMFEGKGPKHVQTAQSVQREGPRN